MEDDLEGKISLVPSFSESNKRISVDLKHALRLMENVGELDAVTACNVSSNSLDFKIDNIQQKLHAQSESNSRCGIGSNSQRPIHHDFLHETCQGLSEGDC